MAQREFAKDAVQSGELAMFRFLFASLMLSTSATAAPAIETAPAGGAAVNLNGVSLSVPESYKWRSLTFADGSLGVLIYSPTYEDDGTLGIKRAKIDEVVCKSSDSDVPAGNGSNPAEWNAVTSGFVEATGAELADIAAVHADIAAASFVELKTDRPIYGRVGLTPSRVFRSAGDFRDFEGKTIVFHGYAEQIVQTESQGRYVEMNCFVKMNRAGGPFVGKPELEAIASIIRSFRPSEAP